jgi:hypothetical protein
LTRVERASHTAYGASLASGVGTLEYEYQRMIDKTLVTRQFGELALVFVEIGRVNL